MPRDAGYLYAIKVEGTNAVKIGCTTGTVAKRLRGLQTAYPSPLQVLASIPFPASLLAVERHMHHLLAEHWRQGEWFNLALTREQFLALAGQAWELAQRDPHPKPLPGTRRRPRLDSKPLGRPRVSQVSLSPEQEEMRQIRHRMSITPDEFAGRMGVSVDTVYRWESGRRGVSTTALKLARFLLAAQ